VSFISKLYSPGVSALNVAKTPWGLVFNKRTILLLTSLIYIKIPGKGNCLLFLTTPIKWGAFSPELLVVAG